MRRGHFVALKPVCPRCRLAGRSSLLRLHAVLESRGDLILSGIIHCDAVECRLEFPIIDGIPVIVPDVASYLASGAGQVLRRQDLPDALATLVGDALGPASEFDTTRQQLSLYCAAHYRDYESAQADGRTTPDVALSMAAGFAGLAAGAPAIDLGCAVGRGTFELAGLTRGPTLGIDLNFAMLQVAQSVMNTGRLRYDRRRVGLVYQRRDFPVPALRGNLVDFWACDLLAVPFAAATFHSAVALNVLDCVGAPRQLLTEMEHLLAPGGCAFVTSPYDWSPHAASPSAWIGGHSQRSQAAGASEAVIRSLVQPGAGSGSPSGLRLEQEFAQLPWRLPLHDRATMEYLSEGLLLRRM